MHTSRREPRARGIVKDDEWESRHLRDEGWIEGYWKSRDHPHRVFLADRISKFSPKRVLEIGCASGPNLYLIAKKFPDAKVRGIDVNPLAVQKGNEWFNEEGMSNVRLEVGKAQELGRFSDGSFDVVFTDAVLIYVHPSQIRNVVKEMVRIGRVIVLNEWHIFSKLTAMLLNTYYYFRSRPQEYGLSLVPRSLSLGLFVGHWARDYEALFKEFVAREKVHISRLPKNLWNDRRWRRWGALVEVSV